VTAEAVYVTLPLLPVVVLLLLLLVVVLRRRWR
jgi:hypothetical protein